MAFHKSPPSSFWRFDASKCLDGSLRHARDDGNNIIAMPLVFSFLFFNQCSCPTLSRIVSFYLQVQKSIIPTHHQQARWRRRRAGTGTCIRYEDRMYRCRGLPSFVLVLLIIYGPSFREFLCVCVCCYSLFLWGNKNINFSTSTMECLVYEKIPWKKSLPSLSLALFSLESKSPTTTTTKKEIYDFDSGVNW